MLFKTIENQIEKLEVNSIALERQNVLQPLVNFIQTRIENNATVRLNFICTHNSRRSHLSQVWAQTLAHYYKINAIFCYSGGTEATALFPVAAQTLEHTGFEIEIIANGNNPIYAIKYSDNEHPILGFSKKFDSNFNPNSDFAAILTCSSADKECPYIANAAARIPITYEDPKAFDSTPQQAEKYQERSLQIATELKFVFSQIKH
jgi:arsenate reductase (thioredoxin)